MAPASHLTPLAPFWAWSRAGGFSVGGLSALIAFGRGFGGFGGVSGGYLPAGLLDVSVGRVDLALASLFDLLRRRFIFGFVGLDADAIGFGDFLFALGAVGRKLGDERQQPAFPLDDLRIGLGSLFFDCRWEAVLARRTGRGRWQFALVLTHKLALCGWSVCIEG